MFGVLTKGKMDAARVRLRLREIGYTDQKLKDWLWQIEPLRIAHRLEPGKNLALFRKVRPGGLQASQQTISRNYRIRLEPPQATGRLPLHLCDQRQKIPE